LKFLLDQRLSTIPQHQWASKLLGFDFRVEYKPGKMNVVADALSRRDTETSAEAMALSAPSFQLFEDLCAAYTADATLTSLHQEVRDGLRGKQWAMVDDLVTRGGRIYVPASSPLVEELLATAHDAGHEGTQKTLHRLHADFFVPGTRTIVRNFVHGCITCQKNKTEHLHPAGLLQPLGVPSAIWADISMDFIEGFHKINGKSVILTVVDRFSKAAHFITLGHPYTATAVAHAFFTEIVRLHGIPSSIVSDRDPTFTSNFWQELFKLSGVRLQMSSAFHPQSDEQTEVVNKIITMYLRCLTGDRPRQWLQWLPWAEFCYNSTHQSSLRTSSFRVVFGRDPPPPPSARASQA
jgi:transposase InsO family protein